MTNVPFSKAIHYNGYIIGSDNDMWILLLSTVRYSMGRQTYMSSLAWELVDTYNLALTDDQLRQVITEIQDELTRYEAMGTFLGSEIDHRSWQKGVTRLSQILHERRERANAQTLSNLPATPSDVPETEPTEKP